MHNTAQWIMQTQRVSEGRFPISKWKQITENTAIFSYLHWEEEILVVGRCFGFKSLWNMSETSRQEAFENPSTLFVDNWKRKRIKMTPSVQCQYWNIFSNHEIFITPLIWKWLLLINKNHNCCAYCNYQHREYIA